jgi:hypothetical protein
MCPLRTPLWRRIYTRNWFQAVSCNCIVLLDTHCLRPVPLTFESPVWLVLLNRFMKQRASFALTIGVQKRVDGKSVVLAYILVKERLSCTVRDDGDREGLRNV